MQEGGAGCALSSESGADSVEGERLGAQQGFAQGPDEQGEKNQRHDMQAAPVRRQLHAAGDSEIP